MDNEFIANILLQLATYGKVCFAQRDVRWQKAIQAYRYFCIASGIEPVMIPAGTDGSRVESKMKMPSSWTAEDAVKATAAFEASISKVFFGDVEDIGKGFRCRCPVCSVKKES